MSRRDMAGHALSMGALVAGLGLAASPRGARAQVEFAPDPDDIWTRHGTLARAGGVLHYALLDAKTDIAAKRAPVVLLHKLGGWVADWRGVAPLLAQDRPVIAIDLPGHGQSRWNGTPPAVQTVEETAMLVRGALLELGRTLGFGHVHVAGTSLGGCVAVALAALCPELVGKLALPSCVLGAGTSWEAILEKEAKQARDGQFSAEGDPLPTDAALSKAVFHLDHAREIAAEQNASRRVAGHWIRPQERGVALTDFTRLMPRITAPTLLLYGARDTYFLAYRDEALGHLRQGRSIVLPDVSGFPVQDSPVRTGEALAAFLQD
ncbi:alpha/beta fold hydrolase [Novosphingobium profundi]|uniref:alpha/beta fold hydrolase n=1 Tax=Novosphingobium profundi TaxID=1774954 RepID=UPI001BD98D08|nr:alpha/beta hydrolase [Novosphingobium profundi]MBT0669521.1 alpha/beta fold hydrolase [Novosphingobium profundi]